MSSEFQNFLRHNITVMARNLGLPHYILMIPKEDWKYAGSGGGGQSKDGGVTPFFCKRCGKTIKSRKSVIEDVDVCRKCRRK